MSKQKLEIDVEVHQDLIIKIRKDGTIIPCLSHTTYIGNMATPSHEDKLPLAEALDRLIAQKTRSENDAVTEHDRKKLLTNFIAIQDLVREKIEAIKALPKFEGEPPEKKLKF